MTFLLCLPPMRRPGIKILDKLSSKLLIRLESVIYYIQISEVFVILRQNDGKKDNNFYQDYANSTRSLIVTSRNVFGKTKVLRV